MAIHHAQPAEVIDLAPLGEQLRARRTTTLIKTDSLEVTRLVLPAGKWLPEHHVPGEITVLCLEGRVVFGAGDIERELSRGHLLYLDGGRPHHVRAVEDSTLLVSIVLTHPGNSS